MTDTKLTSLTQIKVGDFVKLVDRDDQGRFSYTGQVTNIETGKEVKKEVHGKKVSVIEDSSFEMKTFEGIMGFNMDEPDIHELYKTTTKPKGWGKFIKNPKGFKEPEIVEVTKTKKELVFDLVSDNSRKGEKALLKLATEKIGGSTKQLSTYIKLAKLKIK